MYRIKNIKGFSVINKYFFSLILFIKVITINMIVIIWNIVKFNPISKDQFKNGVTKNKICNKLNFLLKYKYNKKSEIIENARLL